MTSKTPPGWAWTTLGEVSTLGPKPERDKLSPNMQVSFVPMRSVEPLSGRINLAETKPASEVMHGYTYFEDGDVLSAKVTPCMENGKVAIARGLKGGIGFGSTEFHVIRPSPGLAPEYVFFYLTQQTVRSDAKRSMGGAVGLLRVPASFLAELDMPLPPSSEQRRIVAKIEELFSQLDAGVEELKKAKAQLKRYRQSVLKAAFDGKLTEEWRKRNLTTKTPRHKETARELLDRIREERKKALGRKYKEPPPLDTSELPELPDGWVYARLPDLGELNRGKSKYRPRDDKSLYDGPYPFVQTGDVRNSGGTIREYSQTYNEVGLRQSRLWPKGTLCITIAANIAETAILGIDACFPDSMVGFVADERISGAGYVHYWLSSVRSKIDAGASATAQKNINLAVLGDLAVPMPHPSEQHEIVAEIERRLSVADAEEKAIEAALRQAGRLRQSILKRAFEGRLVPQDPSDPPASELLARIRQEKTKRQAAQPRKRGGR